MCYNYMYDTVNCVYLPKNMPNFSNKVYGQPDNNLIACK